MLKGNAERWWVSEASVLQGNRRHFIPTPTPPPREMCRRHTSLHKKSQMLLHHSHTHTSIHAFLHVGTPKICGFSFCLKIQTHKKISIKPHKHINMRKSTCKTAHVEIHKTCFRTHSGGIYLQSPGQMLSRFPEECSLREKGKAPETGFESQGRFFYDVFSCSF